MNEYEFFFKKKDTQENAVGSVVAATVPDVKERH